MPSHLHELFEDETFTRKIKNKLPYLFYIAELESSRAGKIGMEVGSVREKILIALLIGKFGENNVETQIPITESEVDVKLFGQPISIKTITGNNGVKVSWTVDAQKAREFCDNYAPKCEILLVKLDWKNPSNGGIFLIPLDVQQRILQQMGKEKYLTLPKAGTNPRGVEISRKALEKLLQDGNTKRIQIVWRHPDVEFNPYKRWVDYWNE